ncbi:ATPase [Sinorhizobium medicae]|uniref:ATPase n=1 Tax=Sinorhizobium medicae TaxID=110321 RepID=A0ABX4TSY0_9HYPH|nr:SRPBCC family protein [Sinorhizobium medicae]MBO1960028.1 SRPBCC family protein [Sinorhizobium medicae]MDX0694557.1 ATPase [Sinorhizobium medicae]MDX0743740.1 ATPase [Sinorhizobium medicae]MDX0771746.1 ATPase [Sinorhizobium medicae]MDX0906697.1 ATPase [Sinorhizobium medicae]
MTEAQLFHGTFTLKRIWAAPPHRVFDAWSDPQFKAQWFTGPPERWTLLRRSMDFRVGGQEVLEGRFHESGTVTLFEARYHAIEPARRLVYTYDLHHSGRFHSVTLSSLQLESEAGGTRVSYTEQIVFLNGKDGTSDRHHGTEVQFDMIEANLRSCGAMQ